MKQQIKTSLLNTCDYMTDGGLETTLIYHHGVDLRAFAAFELLNQEKGKTILKSYYTNYLQLAKKYSSGIIIDTPTWRSNTDWGAKLGYDIPQLNTINKNAVHFLREISQEFEYAIPDILLNGCIGPRGDGYKVEDRMTVSEATEYHLPQVSAFAMADADMVSAITMNYPEEAIGIALAAKSCNIPVVISFTLETDGKLAGGENLPEVIQKVDRATDNYVSYFMINCAHPTHFTGILNSGNWLNRIKGIRANASKKSHQELDESESLDTGNLEELALEYKFLNKILPNLKVRGGCCGTDHTHLEAILKQRKQEAFS